MSVARDASPTTARDTGTWKDAAAAAVPAWLTARAVVFAALGLAHYFADEVRPGRALVLRSVHDGLLAWDGEWYTSIAAHGYGASSSDALRFFPGYPMLGRAFGLLLGDHVALVLIANVAALLAAMLLYRLVRSEHSDAALATRAAWFLSLAPSAFVFVMAYSDALAILFAIAMFLAMRRGSWWWAASRRAWSA